ncbi:MULTISPECIES: erythromycin resistance leader peptide [Heyndrickxia]|nr:erythromycin resistance leader peptide [Heyndrickxia oleronia]
MTHAMRLRFPALNK